ncbi:MAG: MATE family efflux transporter [Oscillospiraceae bacterium]|nr:MATE family efflux transporter [Oscillospiraceae bacterium]
MNDFTEGKITKQLLLFSAPMLIGNLFQQMYSVVDMIVVGRYVSGGALAAIGVSMNVIMFILSVLIGLTTGASVVLSQFYGAKEYDSLKKTVSVSILSLLCVAVVLTLLGTTLAPFFLRLLNTNDDVFDDAVLYMRILMGGIVFPVFYNMYTAYMRALGDSRRPLYFLICATMLNIALDLYFVIGLDLGVLGVAVATVTSQMVSVVMCVVYATRKIPLLRVSKLEYDSRLFRLILRYGTPAAMRLAIVSFAQLTITRLINSFGTAAMAGITAATRIDQFAIMPVSNLSSALSTFVAQNMGAEKEDRALKGFRSALISMLVCAVFMSIVLMIFSHPLISIFLKQGDIDTPEILRIGGEYLNVMVVFYFLFAILFSFNGFFQGVGDAIMAMAFPVVSLTIRALSAYALVGFVGMGPEALAWSIPIGWGLGGLGSWIYYKKRLWVGKTATQAMSAASQD